MRFGEENNLLCGITSILTCLLSTGQCLFSFALLTSAYFFLWLSPVFYKRDWIPIQAVISSGCKNVIK